MKIVYMGTPEFAVQSLDALINSHHQVVAVCTQPDRPAGRGHKLTPSPVKVKALEHDIPVLQPETLRLEVAKDVRQQLKEYNADIFVVAAYGILLPKGVLKMPPLGCINIHASLLPKYRGASPIHAALLNGDHTTGITIMQMDTGLDTGDMIHKKEIAIEPEEHFPALHNRLATLGASAMLEALEQLEKGTAIHSPQDNNLSSYAGLITKAHAQINWHNTCESIVSMTRAYDPWPGSQTMYLGAPLKIWRLEPAPAPTAKAAPGTVLEVDPSRGLLIQAGDGALWATELQGDGSKRMLAADYLRGRDIKVGTLLDQSLNHS